jgi:NAD(P)-dependent dehydrogenase (short-subunit alcohol dehydrogenase family)
MGTVLITGCSSGLGRSTARYFATQGWDVVATMRRPDGETADLDPERVLVEQLDVADATSIEAAIQNGVRRFGGLDAVVNNAGISTVSAFEAMPDEIVRRLFETNVFGTMNVTRAAIPYLRQSRGAIVNITSGVGFVAVPLLSLYVASKHAIEGFSESLAYELESQAIRVKLVEPGAMRTTQFSANTVAAAGELAVPAPYQRYFDHALGAMMNYPFADTPEQAVVEAIFRAATDGTQRLRYPVGPDVEEYARLRWSTSEDVYSAEMSRLVGQTAWRGHGQQ